MSNQALSKSVLITGCSTGIGRATALRLAQAGWKVYATARGVEKLADLEKAGCRTLALDVMDEASMVEAVRQVEKEDGAVGCSSTTRATASRGRWRWWTIEGVRRQFETNVFGLLRLTQLVLPGMRRQGWGKVVNIGSMGGKPTFPGGGAYHATKYAVEALGDVLRFEVRGFGVDVVLIQLQPGLIRTEFSQAAVGSMSTSLRKADGPCAGFNSAVARSTQDAYVKGPLAMLGGEADDVARVIQRAIEARRPRARYTVNASAKVLLMQRAMMLDGMWDAFLRTQFPQPGAKN